MKLMKYDQSNQIFFISGMFAGSWTWERCRQGVLGNHIFMQDPLMGISGDVFKIIDMLSAELRKLDKPVTLVGNSLGGHIALALAKHNPQNVEKVIISGCAGFSTLQLDIKDCLSRQKTLQLSQRLADLICHNKSKANEADRERMAKDLKAHFRNMLGLFKGCNLVSSADTLKDVQCEVKAIWGDQDIVSPYSDAADALNKHGVESIILKDTGHSPMYESPIEFANALNLFLTGESYTEQAA